MLKNLKLDRSNLVPDLMSGLTVALVSIPEGMAYALVAGVNPVYGLYTGMLTTIIASILGSTSLMIVTLTNAMALVTSEQLGILDPAIDPVRAMFTLTLLVGTMMFLLGFFKLGSVIRFISREVLAGFIFATALLIVLGQYKDLVGYASELDANKVVKAIDITMNYQQWETNTVVVGFGAIILLFVLKRTRLKRWADALVILITTLFVYAVRWDSVELVGEIAQVPSGLAAIPKPVLPLFSAIPLLLTGAIAATVVGLAEGSGVGTAYPNPDGTKSNLSRDFVAQGAGNLVGSFFQAMPACASLSRTGVNNSGGARTRWAGVFAGLLLMLVLIFFGQYTEFIPMPGLAAVLIVVGIEVMEREGRELMEGWKVSRFNTSAAIITILLGLFEDLTVAIFGGTIISLLLYAFTTANQFKAVRMIRNPDGGWEEQDLPKVLLSNEATIISLDGNVYFASVYSFDDFIPAYHNAKNAVIILHMRDRMVTSLTGVKWLQTTVKKVRASGNLLMLAGVDDKQLSVAGNTELAELIGKENIFIAQPQIGASMSAALDAANKWIVRNSTTP
jgi:SulP family sulfate permease